MADLVPLVDEEEASATWELEASGNARDVHSLQRWRILVACVASVAFLCVATRPSASGRTVALAPAPQPVQLHESPEALVAKYADLISSLNITVLDCPESLDKLMLLKDAKPSVYMVNAMLETYAVGERAMACNLVDYDVHQDSPTSEQKTCVVHCGEPGCGAALNFVDKNQDNIGTYCEEMFYLQGGAKCWVESGLHLANATACGEIVGADVPCDNC